VLGFGDPAEDRYGLEPVKEDLGQTMAVYGIGDGFYLVLPILGPSTLRDTAGRVGDSFLNPVHYVEPTETRIGIYTFRYINRTSLDIGEYERFKSGERDAYINVRNKYFDYRRRVIGQ
jgi:phospholipid-binding lipoprotein MlaA